MGFGLISKPLLFCKVFTQFGNVGAFVRHVKQAQKKVYFACFDVKMRLKERLIRLRERQMRPTKRPIGCIDVKNMFKTTSSSVLSTSKKAFLYVFAGKSGAPVQIVVVLAGNFADDANQRVQADNNPHVKY